jgi:hypothetical protein
MIKYLIEYRKHSTIIVEISCENVFNFTHEKDQGIKYRIISPYYCRGEIHNSNYLYNTDSEALAAARKATLLRCVGSGESDFARFKALASIIIRPLLG